MDNKPNRIIKVFSGSGAVYYRTWQCPGRTCTQGGGYLSNPRWQGINCQSAVDCIGAQNIENGTVDDNFQLV
jgi:hypothetical protein